MKDGDTMLSVYCSFSARSGRERREVLLNLDTPCQPDEKAVHFIADMGAIFRFVLGYGVAT